jgi:hypothetical protein
MIKAGVRYTRIPDPAHVLNARGWARGEERKTDNHRKRSPIKNVYLRHIIFLRANTVGPSARKLNKRFVHSFIHSFMFLGLPDPNPLVRGTDPDPSLFFF